MDGFNSFNNIQTYRPLQELKKEVIPGCEYELDYC